MSLSVIVIVLFSTFMHASWNLIARYGRSESTFYAKMLITIAVAGFVPAVWSEVVTRSLTLTAWLCVTGSGFSAGLYLFFLARAFESSDFTVVYPVARSLPVVFVALGDVLRGRYLTPVGWLGILLVASGCVLVPGRSFGDLSLRRYFNRSTLWMLLAALGTVGYTLLDKIAAEAVRPGLDTAVRYGYFYFTISYLPYRVLLHFCRPGQPRPGSMEWRLAVPAGLLSFVAYGLILWAYQLSPYASYIVAFRQFSIVLGAIMAFILYKEQGVAVRLTGAFFITAGLVLIAGWGR
jgi:drug/metabolite transporter (DMT)-like permease